MIPTMQQPLSLSSCSVISIDFFGTHCFISFTQKVLCCRVPSPSSTNLSSIFGLLCRVVYDMKQDTNRNREYSPVPCAKESIASTDLLASFFLRSQILLHFSPSRLLQTSKTFSLPKESIKRYSIYTDIKLVIELWAFFGILTNL